MMAARTSGPEPDVGGWDGGRRERRYDRRWVPDGTTTAEGPRADGRDVLGWQRDQGDLRAIWVPGDEWQRRDQ